MNKKVKSRTPQKRVSVNTYTAPETLISFRPDPDDRKRLEEISKATGSKRTSEIIRQALKTKVDSLAN